jgi:error-prone DNA polymerase
MNCRASRGARSGHDRRHGSQFAGRQCACPSGCPGNRLRQVVGCRLDFRDGSPSVLCYPADRGAYGRLCRLLTEGKRRADKGECLLDYEHLLEFDDGPIVVTLAPGEIAESFHGPLQRLKADFAGRAYLGLNRPRLA